MLTVDLVRARKYGGELKLTQLKGKSRKRARDLARAFLDLAHQHTGSTRGELDDAFSTVSAAPRERKLALGLRKLVEDACVFEGAGAGDARELRRQVFTLAAEVRRALEPGEDFDRTSVLERVAEARGADEGIEDLDRSLYADLRAAQRLVEPPALSGGALVDRYDLAQAQAVLLRATRVTAEVECRDAASYRYLFRQLKFRRLLHAIHHSQRYPGGYRIEIDGPYSLFTSVTKYGLQLALVFNAIQGCRHWTIDAALLWGRDRKPLAFRLSGSTRGSPGDTAAEARGGLTEEVVALLEGLEKLDTPWQAEPSTDVLELTGLGICVPDLRFVNGETGEVAYLEVLGYWSRDAVWKRVELVQAGLQQRVIFGVPKRLRVSESVLDEDLPGELYVYRGKMSPKVIITRLDGVTKTKTSK